MERRQMIISNTTPLINFSAICRLDILEKLFGKICIPSAVEKELFVKGENYPNISELRKANFIETLEAGNILFCNALKRDLDDGEAEAIALALEKNGQLLLMDEISGREIAESYSLRFTGTIGCIVEAKKIGIIASVKPLLDEIRIKARFWINPKLYERILEENQG